MMNTTTTDPRAADSLRCSGSAGDELPMPCDMPEEYPPTLTWCADGPAAAGRFWWQSSPLGDAIVVTVFLSPEGLSVRTERGHMMMFLFSRLWPEQRWAGPLPKPQEPSPVESL